MAASLTPFIQAIERSGATVVYLPAGGAPSVDNLDGLILGGGRDIDPQLYGEQRISSTQHPDTERDRFEIQLIELALRNGVPTLAVCRGMQLLNVAFGGSLQQDLGPRLPLHVVPEPPDADAHEIAIEPLSRIAGVIGKPSVFVNSRHHQAIVAPAPGIRAVAFAPDGVVEAVEVAERPNWIGVQWHPEDRAGSFLEDQALFDWLAGNARQYRAELAGV